MFEKVIQISNHGTSTGIWPRFLMQMSELRQFAIGKKEFDDRTQMYFETVLPEIEKFYDIYHKFKTLLKDYQEGIQSGKYYSLDSNGQTMHNQIPEREISNTAKDFFVYGKIMIVNFVKSGVVDEGPFKLEDFYFSDLKKFQTKKLEYEKNSNCLFIPLIELIGKAQMTFLQPFNKIRGDIEHNHFQIDSFKLEMNHDTAFVFEPLFEGRILSCTLQFYYDNILDFLEKLFVYFLGIKAESQSSIIKLFVRHQFDYPNLLFKYTMAIGGNVLLGTQAERCKYD